MTKSSSKPVPIAPDLTRIPDSRLLHLLQVAMGDGVTVAQELNRRQRPTKMVKLSDLELCDAANTCGEGSDARAGEGLPADG
jgi:hypothetical protein